eukprot:757436-Hanusia_phi.AAC.9
MEPADEARPAIARLLLEDQAAVRPLPLPPPPCDLVEVREALALGLGVGESTHHELAEEAAARLDQVKFGVGRDCLVGVEAAERRGGGRRGGGRGGGACFCAVCLHLWVLAVDRAMVGIPLLLQLRAALLRVSWAASWQVDLLLGEGGRYLLPAFRPQQLHPLHAVGCNARTDGGVRGGAELLDALRVEEEVQLLLALNQRLRGWEPRGLHHASSAEGRDGRGERGRGPRNVGVAKGRRLIRG